MAVVVLGLAVLVDEVGSIDDIAREVRMSAVDAGVETATIAPRPSDTPLAAAAWMMSSPHC